MQLPDWLSRNAAGAYVVDADKAYPAALAALGFDAKAADQYELECAYQCIKFKVQEMVAATDDDPRGQGKPLVISFEAKDKDKWAQAGRPKGKGADVARKGMEARRHYERIRFKF